MSGGGIVVETDHREIVRNRVAAILSRAEDAVGGLIGGGKEGSRALLGGKIKQVLCTSIARLRQEVAIEDERWVGGDARLLERAQIAPETIV